MANHYLTSSFVLEMSTEDAEMVRLAQRASEALSDLADEVSYADLGPRFAALFPPKDGDDFGSFLDLFDALRLERHRDVGTDRDVRVFPTSRRHQHHLEHGAGRG